MRIALLTNGPGELQGWARPLAAELARREEIWNRLADSVDRHRLAAMTRVIGLPDAIDAARRIVDGGIAGRTVVAVRDL